MKNEKKISFDVKVIPMSKATKKRLSEVAEEIKGKKLFPEKIEFAKKTLEDVKLPI